MKIHDSKNWESIELDTVSSFNARELLPRLASNEIAAVKISNIFTIDEVQEMAGNIKKQGVHWYPNFEFKQGRIGICATEYHSKVNGKLAYFALQPEQSKIRNNMFPGTLDPVARMFDVFSDAYAVSVATEPNLENANYFTGLVRAMQHESTIHFDYAPHQLPGWWVSETEAQFAIVIYLQMPGSGGGLTVYNHPWEIADDKYNKDIHEKGPRGFEETVLGGINSTTINPSEGDMVIFNSRNFHKVEALDSDRARFSVNTFMSLKDDKLYFWN
jgi:hypothetical protein